MGRPATGQIVEYKGRDGRIYRSLRFRAGGRRHTVPLGVVSRADAERELAHVMADVARGLWKPAAVVEAPVEVEVPTFHAFSEEWWVRNEKRFAPKTHTDYRWRLECHLLPHFAALRLDAITFDTVERYVAAKLAEGERIREAAASGEPITQEYADRTARTRRRRARALSPRSINMTVTLLAAILESAVERELIARNPAKGKGRRVRERAPRRSWLETAAQIEALLDAASELDKEATKERAHVERRAMLAVLVFAGLRINELCALRLRDVDLAAGWLHTGSKTDAGRRTVKIRGALRDVLLDLRDRQPPPDADADGFVFATRGGRQMSADNVRSRVLGCPAIIVDGEEKKAGKGAVGRANANLARDGLPPLPDKLTPHSLRRTFCSLLYALGEPPPVVMAEMGHTDPGLALRVYAQAMRRGEEETAQLRALVEGHVWANTGERAGPDQPPPPDRRPA